MIGYPTPATGILAADRLSRPDVRRQRARRDLGIHVPARVTRPDAQFVYPPASFFSEGNGFAAPVSSVHKKKGKGGGGGKGANNPESPSGTHH